MSPFINSMAPDNEPGDDSSTAPEDDRDGMGPERKASQGTNGSVGVNPGYPLPPDPHAPPGDINKGNSTEISDFGISDQEVVGSGSLHQYGLVGK